MITLIAGLFILLVSAGPAAADPIVTPIIVSLLTAGGVTAATAATAAAIIAPIIVTGALVGASLLLAQRPKLPDPQDGKILVKSAVPPKQWGVGTSRQIGALIASEMAGSTSYDISAMHSGRVSAYRYFYAGEDLVEFADSYTGPTLPNPGPGYVRAAGPYPGRYMGDGSAERSLYIDWRLGLSTETAYAQMVAALPDIWTTNHRGDGVATVLVIAETPDEKNFSKRFPGGLAKVAAVGDWTIAWDPRDETQDINDPTTWQFSENPFVLLLDFYVHHEAGFHRPIEQVYEPVSGYWIEAMNVCDEPVAKDIGGFEKRYAASGRYDADTPRKSVVEAYLRCCDGYLEEVGGGAIVVYAGKFYSSNFTLTDLDVIDDSVIFNKNDNEATNTINVKVVSDEHDYNEVEADPVINQAAIDAGAPRKAVDINAEFSSRWRQSRRLAWIELSKQIAPARGTALVNLVGENLKGLRFFRIDIPDRGDKLTNVWAEKKTLEDRVSSDGGWYLEYEIADPARYDPRPEGAPPQVPDNSEDDDLPVPVLPTLTVVRQQIAGGGVIAVISATDPPVSGWPDLRLDGHFRRVGDSVWQSMSAPDDDLQVFSSAVTDGAFEVQTRFTGGGGGSSDYSPTATITVVSDATAPGSPTAFTLSGATTKALSAQAANSANVKSLEFRRGGPSDTFASATSLGSTNCGPNQVIAASDIPGTGAWKYYANDANGSNVAAVSPAGPLVTGVSTEAEAFLTRAGTTDETRKGLYRYLIARLVSAGLWAKLDGLYLLCAADAATAVLNLKSSSFTLTPHGTLTFTPNVGYTGDGSTGYLDTGFNPGTAGGVFAQDSAHMGVYILTAPNYTSGSTTFDVGATNADISMRQVSLTSGLSHGNAASGKTITNTGTAVPAHVAWSRTASTGYAHYLLGFATSAATATSAALQSLNFFVGAHNVAGSAANFSSRQVSAVHFGSGLSSTDAANLYAILHDFHLSVGAVSV